MRPTIDLLRDDITEDIEERATIRERLVLWLLKHPYQRTEDVALALNLHPSSAYRHLATLTSQGLTESVRPSIGVTNVRSFFYLTTPGIQMAAQLVGAVPEKLARMWEADERSLLRLLPRLHNLATLQTVINSLVAHAPRALAYPGGYPAAIRWHWARDYQHSFLAKGKQTSCRVDAVLVFARQPSQYTRTASARVEPSSDEPAYYTLFLHAFFFIFSWQKRLTNKEIRTGKKICNQIQLFKLSPISIFRKTSQSIERLLRYQLFLIILAAMESISEECTTRSECSILLFSVGDAEF